MTEKAKLLLIDWENIRLDNSYLDFIYNYLLENEIPMTPFDLAKAIVSEKIRLTKKEISRKEKSKGRVYRPNETYEIGDTITFPLLSNQQGVVKDSRAGVNPDISDFSVTTFEMEDGSLKQFASRLSQHKLNDFDYSGANHSKELDPNEVYKKYGRKIAYQIQELLSASDGLVSIANYWFPQALLSEINPGYLNLAEAVLEMEESRPVPTANILSLIEYPLDSNDKLTAFSFNYALQADDRFDEVGPTGQILWALKLLEPEDVRKKPLTLQYNRQDSPLLPETARKLLDNIRIHDELDLQIDNSLTDTPESSFNVCISYPHWKAGTLPLINEILPIFPTALETKRVIFDFVDSKTNNVFPGWVVIPEKYVSGLKSWFRQNNVIPGSMIRISKGEDDTVNVALIPPRASKDWIRTALFDSKGRIYFETRHQMISTEFDERMCIYIENSPQLDVLWEQYNKSDVNLKRLIEIVFKDLSRSNPQGIVHFQEIYAGINMMRRFPPASLLAAVLNDDQFIQLDNLYFKLKTTEVSEEVY